MICNRHNPSSAGESRRRLAQPRIVGLPPSRHNPSSAGEPRRPSNTQARPRRSDPVTTRAPPGNRGDWGDRAERSAERPDYKPEFRRGIAETQEPALLGGQKSGSGSQPPTAAAKSRRPLLRYCAKTQCSCHHPSSPGESGRRNNTDHLQLRI